MKNDKREIVKFDRRRYGKIKRLRNIDRFDVFNLSAIGRLINVNPSTFRALYFEDVYLDKTLFQKKVAEDLSKALSEVHHELGVLLKLHPRDPEANYRYLKIKNDSEE